MAMHWSRHSAMSSRRCSHARALRLSQLAVAVMVLVLAVGSLAAPASADGRRPRNRARSSRVTAAPSPPESAPPAPAPSPPPTPPPAPTPFTTPSRPGFAGSPPLLSPTQLVEEPRPPGIAITTNPLAILAGQLSAEIEFRLSRRISGYVAGYYQAAGLLLAPDVNAIGATLGARFYVGAMPVEGFWFGFDASGFIAWAGSAVAAGQGYAATLGYTWVTDSGFVFSLGGGGQLTEFDLTTGDGSTYSGFAFRPVLRLALGFAL